MHEHLKDSATLAKAAEKAASTNWTPEFLDAHQSATLTVLAERIVPGSTKAQVMQFVDLLLSVDTPENQKKFLASLGAFEAEAIQLGHPSRISAPSSRTRSSPKPRLHRAAILTGKPTGGLQCLAKNQARRLGSHCATTSTTSRGGSAERIIRPK